MNDENTQDTFGEIARDIRLQLIAKNIDDHPVKPAFFDGGRHSRCTFTFAEIDGHAQQLPECLFTLQIERQSVCFLAHAEPSHVYAIGCEAFAKMFEDGIGAANMRKDKIGKLA